MSREEAEQTQKVPTELYREFKRNLYETLLTNLPYVSYQRMISLIGPRQTGKTTLVYQLIQSLLDQKINPERILFLNISDLLMSNNMAFLEELMQEYQQAVLKETFSSLKLPIYVFLDEIQYLHQWELFLKRYYDLKFKIKFILTGSASLIISQKSKESLVGRLDENKLAPFSFTEFVSFKNWQKKINPNSAKFSHGFGPKDDPYSFSQKEILSQKTAVVSAQNQMKVLRNEFVERGGFPASYLPQNLDTAYRYLNQDVLERVLTQDIPQVTTVRDPKLLQTLLIYAAQKSGGVFAYDNLAQETGARIETIKNYFLYLSSSFLIHELNKFRKSEIAKFKSRKKLYICDLGLRNSLLKLSRLKILSHEYKGVNAETLVVNHLKNKGENISFWQKDKYEVDVIMEMLKTIIPIEVKYQNRIAPDDLKGLTRFMEMYKLPKGLVITDSLLEQKNNLFFMPLWLFLLNQDLRG